MSDLSNLFDAFYSQFVLRDFFGKIIPGFLLILSIAVSLTSLNETDEYLKSMSGWMWLMTGGVGWIGGFLVQSFGEVCGFFRAFPKNSTFKESFQKLIRFSKSPQLTDHERRTLERFVVIKEACGNSYIAISIASLILLSDKLFNKSHVTLEGFQLIMIVCLIIFSVIFLGHMHFKHVKNQDQFVDAFLEEARNP